MGARNCSSLGKRMLAEKTSSHFSAKAAKALGGSVIMLPCWSSRRLAGCFCTFFRKYLKTTGPTAVDLQFSLILFFHSLMRVDLSASFLVVAKMVNASLTTDKPSIQLPRKLGREGPAEKTLRRSL